LITFPKYCINISAITLNISEPHYWPKSVGEDITNRNTQ